MTRFPRVLPLALPALLLLPACQSEADRQAEAAEQATAEMERRAQDGDLAGAMEAFGEAMGAAGDQPRAEPVDFRRLRDLLPEEAAGLARTEVEGARQGAMGFTVSQAEATYAAGDASVDVKITDMGNFPGLAMMGLGWAMGEVDRETATGYERTTTFRGHRAYEKADDAGYAELQVLVAGRFLVEADGSGTTMDQLKGLVEALDLGALEGMRDEGRAS